VPDSDVPVGAPAGSYTAAWPAAPARPSRWRRAWRGARLERRPVQLVAIGLLGLLLGLGIGSGATALALGSDHESSHVSRFDERGTLNGPNGPGGLRGNGGYGGHGR
jgi:hypothetical protein